MALAIRIITPRYFAPVGSWQIRESVKLALMNPPIARGEPEEMMKIIQRALTQYLEIDLFRESKLVKLRKQPTLTQFLT